MEKKIYFPINPQPDDTTCGPTCLHAIYEYYKDSITLDQVIQEIPQFKEGGTLSVLLGIHALRRGYKATLYNYNLQVFDPTWFLLSQQELGERLEAQLPYRTDPKLRYSIQCHKEFIDLGGTILFEDLNHKLIREILKKDIPILTGLSATYLYRSAREYGPKSDYDDLRGIPAGHFVVLCGYNKETRLIQVADPLYPNPLTEHHHYVVSQDRLICSILLGILTYDANLLFIQPKGRPHESSLVCR